MTADQDLLLIDANETARRLGISRRFLHTLTHTGRVPHVRLGHRIMYAPFALQRWITQQTGAARGHTDK